MRKLAWLLLIAAIALPACHHGRLSQMRGSGKRVQQKRQVSAFKSIDTEGNFSIEITCQKDLSVEVEGDDNILEAVSTEVSGEVLRLTNTKSYSVNEPVKLKISVPNLEGLSVTGAGRIDIRGMSNDAFDIDSEGAPFITVAGKTKVIKIDSNGAGVIDTHELSASRATVESNGASKIDLDVADQLDVTVSGASTVIYKGDPVVKKTVHGPGVVQRRGGEGA